MRLAGFAFALLMMVAGTLGDGAAETYTYNGPLVSAQTKAAMAAGRAPEHGLPQILSADWATYTLKPGVNLEATVHTSLNVGYVEARYKYWNMPFEHVAPGEFHLTYHMPFLPPFLLGKWHIDVIARSSDGVEIRRTYEFVYHY